MELDLDIKESIGLGKGLHSLREKRPELRHSSRNDCAYIIRILALNDAFGDVIKTRIVSANSYSIYAGAWS